MTIPTGSPPPELVPKALSYLAMEVGKAAPLGPSAVLPPLSAFLSLLARHRVSAPLGPLHAFSSLCAESPDSVTLPLACDALLAYPAAVCVLDPALSHLRLDWDGLLAALPSRVGAPGGVKVVRLAHSLLRMRSTENAVVKHSQTLVRALARAYGAADARAKGEVLVLARALVGKDAELRRLLENEGPRGVPLVNQSMGRDYADLFEAHRALADGEAAATRDAHDAEHATDPVSHSPQPCAEADAQRLPSLTALFPHIPAHLLSDALAHPAYSGAGASADDAAAPLIDAILGNALPAELSALKAAASADGPAAAASPAAPAVERVPEPAPAPAPAPAPPRRSQFTDADLAKIRIKDSCVPLRVPAPPHAGGAVRRTPEADTAGRWCRTWTWRARSRASCATASCASCRRRRRRRPRPRARSPPRAATRPTRTSTSASSRRGTRARRPTATTTRSTSRAT